MKVGVPLAALLALSVFTDVSSGAEPIEHRRARELFDEGVELARQKKWAESLARLEASTALVERSTTIFNVGTVLLRLGRPTESIRAFERYLEIAPAEDDEGRSAARATIEEARRLVAYVEVAVDPADAEIRVDDVVIQGIGRERHLELDPGERTLRVQARNLETYEAILHLAPGDHMQVAVTLRPSAAPVSAEAIEPLDDAVAPRPAVVSAAISDGEVAVAGESASAHEGGGLFSSPYFWMIAGALAAAVVLGVVVASGSEEPYPGTLDAVLVGLHER